jgi:hypothetical protein
MKSFEDFVKYMIIFRKAGKGSSEWLGPLAQNIVGYEKDVNNELFENADDLSPTISSPLRI